MELVTRKIYEDCTCPYCGHTWECCIRWNTDEIICANPNCEKEFEIEIYTGQIEIRPMKISGDNNAS